VVKPDLTQIREALNEQLCPLFGEDLEFDFDDPVPANREQLVLETIQAVGGGIITREEARVQLGYDPEPDGGTFLMPFSVTPVATSNPKAIKSKSYSDEQKEAMWKSYAEQALRDEQGFIRVISNLFEAQQAEVVENVTQGHDYYFNITEADNSFNESLKPLIEQSFKTGWNFADSTTRRPQKDASILNSLALEWIRTHALELAKNLNATTISELRLLLEAGYAAGESIPNLVKRIEDYFETTRRAIMVARTESIAASNEGALQLYESEGVQKVQWYVALDDRTCDICLPYHNEIFPVQETHGMIPAHPNCRCVWLAVTD
jgi:SPP1 gp7 family putative phage head morphogenesis protein